LKAQCPCEDINTTVPEVYIGSPDTEVFESDWIRFRGYGRFIACGVTLDIPLNYQWTAYNKNTSKEIALMVNASTTMLSLPPFSAERGIYILRLLIGRPGRQFPENSVYVTVKIQSRPVNFRIAGGDRSVGNKGVLTLQVVPIDWNPNYNYLIKWSCCLKATSTSSCAACDRFADQISSFAGRILRLNSSGATVAAGEYTFNVTVDGSVSVASVVNVVGGDIPELSILQITSHHDASRDSTLYALVRNIQSTTSYYVTWYGSSTGFLGLGTLLVIPGGTLKSGATETVNAYLAVGPTNYSAKADLVMAAVPNGGKCVVSYSGTNAISLNTTLTIQTYGWSVDTLNYRFKYNTSTTRDVYLGGFYQELSSTVSTAPITSGLLKDSSEVVTFTVQVMDSTTQTTAEASCTVVVNANTEYKKDVSKLTKYLYSMLVQSVSSGDMDGVLSQAQSLAMVLPASDRVVGAAVLANLMDVLTSSTLSNIQRRGAALVVSQLVDIASTKYRLRRRVMSFLETVVNDGEFTGQDGQDVMNAIGRLRKVSDTLSQKELFCNLTNRRTNTGDLFGDCYSNDTATAYERLSKKQCECQGGVCTYGDSYTKVCNCVNGTTDTCLQAKCENMMVIQLYTEELKVLNNSKQCGPFVQALSQGDRFLNDTIEAFCEADDDCGSPNEYYGLRRKAVRIAFPELNWPDFKNITSTIDSAATNTLGNTLKALAKGFLQNSLGATTLATDGVALTSQNSIISSTQAASVGNKTDNTTVVIPPSVFAGILSNAGVSAEDLTVSFSKLTYSTNPFSNNVNSTDGASTSMDGSVVDFSVGYKGSEYPINNTADWINITIKVSGTGGSNSSIIRSCRFYNTTTSTWESTGVKFLGYNESTKEITCGTRHLSVFATFIDVPASTNMPTPKPPVASSNLTDDGSSGGSRGTVPLMSWLVPLIVGCGTGIVIAGYIVLRKQKPIPEPSMSSPSKPLLDNEMVARPPPNVTQHPMRPNPSDVYAKNPLAEI
jgi:hypothetical protein